MSDTPEKSWFKQAWPWFVFSIPLLTIVAGVITYKIAADNPHSMVQDDYFKKGLAINQSIAKQNYAKELMLSATIAVDKQADLIIVKFDDVGVEANQLKLLFSHPTKERLDKALLLEKLSPNEFAAQAPELKQAYWHIRMLDNDDSWLLKARWHYPQEDSLQIGHQR